MNGSYFFVIRGKLGDTLIAWASVAAYAERHPEAEITLLVRSNYVPLLEHERGARLVAFGSRVEMIAKLLWLRVTRPAFDALAVLWGFGAPIEWIGRLVRARRKIYLDARFASLFPEYPAPARDEYQLDPAWRVLRCLDSDLPRPQRLRLPGLASLRRPQPEAIALVPVADEERRSIDAVHVARLARAIERRHPGDPIWILLDPGEAARIGGELPAAAKCVTFATLEELLDRYARLKAWYGTDTGPYHLAVAMGIPATVFFGPTQPAKNSFPGQTGLVRVRLSALGNEHCEEKQCMRPVCLHQAIANFAGDAVAPELEETPPNCPLRAHPAAALARNS